MKEVIFLGVVLGALGLGGPATAQMQKGPQVVSAQARGESQPAPDDLVKVLESKGILSEAEAALVSETRLQPQTKQLLAEVLLSKHLITGEEYDRTIQACSSPAAQLSPSAPEDSGKVAEPRAALSMFERGGNGEPSGFKSLSDRISSILPGGTETTTDLAFGTIQPGPPLYYPSQDQPRHARAKGGHKSHKHHGQDGSQTTPGPDGGAPKP
jgi:hypothetical protein